MFTSKFEKCSLLKKNSVQKDWVNEIFAFLFQRLPVQLA